MRNLCFEIGFSGLDGIRYATYDSITGNLNAESFSGVFEIKLSIANLPLQPAIYVIDLGVHSGGTGLDYITAVTQVEVLPSPSAPLYRTAGQMGWTPSPYGLTLSADWEISS
jgi:hypothetical protein